MKNAKFSQNKKALYFAIAMLVVLIFLIIVYIRLGENKENSSCKIDEDCVLQQTTCCSCSMGGEERCMTKQEAETTQKKLDEDCSEDIMCIAMYNCKVNSCKCEEGNCLGVLNDETEIANPASAYCIEQGGELEIRENKLGEYGVCIKDGRECEEWDFYRGDCLL
jgi:putative hemolysin